MPPANEGLSGKVRDAQTHRIEGSGVKQAHYKVMES